MREMNGLFKTVSGVVLSIMVIAILFGVDNTGFTLFEKVTVFSLLLIMAVMGYSYLLEGIDELSATYKV